jgi:hypothetical protein
MSLLARSTSLAHFTGTTRSAASVVDGCGGGDARRPEFLSYLFFASLIATTFLL